jgi:futalosine hydrolase
MLAISLSGRCPAQKENTILPTDNLILIPTNFESALIASQLARFEKTHEIVIRHCGFGPIAAAAVATETIINLQPNRVILLGIAGAYHSSGDALTVGRAYRFASVATDGIGVGTGETFQSASDLGWPQFAGDPNRPPIHDELQLASDSPHRLLTVCAASATREQAQRRQQQHTTAAEDMEGFAVAMACQLQNVPLEIIRGISNIAGDRDKSNWRVADALGAAAEELGVVLGETI